MKLALLPITGPGHKGSGPLRGAPRRDIASVVKQMQTTLKKDDQLGMVIELEAADGFSVKGFVGEVKYVCCLMNHITRTAMVGDPRWFRRAAVVVSRFFPNVEIEHFTPLQRDEALIWVAERDVETFS